MYLEHQDAKNRYEEMIRDAARERLALKVRANQPGMRMKAQQIYQTAANRMAQQLKALDKAVSMVLSGSRNSF